MEIVLSLLSALMPFSVAIANKHLGNPISIFVLKVSTKIKELDNYISIIFFYSLRLWTVT